MNRDRIQKWCQENRWSLLIVLGAVLGFGSGIGIRLLGFDPSPTTIAYIGLPGKLLIRAVSLLIVPLIVCSMATSIASTKKGENKKLVLWTFFIFVSLSFLASIFGLTVIHLTRVGVRNDLVTKTIDIKTHQQNKSSTKSDLSEEDALKDVLLNMVPDNIVTVAFLQQYTAIKPIDPNNPSAGTKKVTETVHRTNMMGLCVIALVLGFVLVELDDQVDTIKTLLNEVNQLSMTIIMKMLFLMPIGMFSWLCEEALKSKSPQEVITHLVKFYILCYTCFLFYAFVFLPLLYYLVFRKNPITFHLKLIPVMLMALGTASSMLSYPINLKCCEETLKINRKVTRFVLTLGMTINMNGACMYYSIVPIFVAQMTGIEVTLQQSVAVCISVVLMVMAATGAPTPGGSIIFHLAVCAVIGVPNPMSVLGFMMALDWIRDRLSTISNVIGDSYAAAIVEKFCKDDFEEDEIEQDQKLAINESSV